MLSRSCERRAAQHSSHKFTAGQGNHYEPPGAFSPSSTSDPYRTITAKNDVGHVIGFDVALGQVFHAGRSDHQGSSAISAYHEGMQKLGWSIGGYSGVVPAR